MKKLIPLSLLAALLVSFGLFPTADFIKKIEQHLTTYTDNYPEKIFIHTDKPYYATDENLWFTAYLVNGISHQKSEKSRIVNVELLNNRDSILIRKKLYVSHTSVAGDFKIDKNWKPGTYTLRAYTRYMRNQSSDFFFQKEIPVYELEVNDSLSSSKKSKKNKKKANTTTTVSPNLKKVVETKPRLRFYPEGGYLVANSQNKVAFEISDGENEIDLEATIKDQDGNEILTFKTLKMGLGSFLFIPEANKTYYASFTLNGKEERYPLPKAIEKGYVLNVTNYGNYLLANINTTVEQGLKGTFLVAHEKGRLLYKHYEETSDLNYLKKIPTTSLTDGVVNFTLFDAKGRPVAERLVYVDNPMNDVQVDIQKSGNKFRNRKKVTLEIDVKDHQGNATAANISLAVRDLKAFPYNSRTGNIQSWLLLNSDLKGAIKNPGYFFEKQNDVKRRYLLDLVMMTQGWRRFTWQELLKEKDSVTYTPEKGLYISGVTKHLKKPYTEHSSATRLTFFDPIVQEPIQQSDSLGKFKFGPYIFFDSIPILIESRLYDFKSTKRKNRNVVILVDKEKTKDIKSGKIYFNKNSLSDESKQRKLENFVKVTQYIKEEKFKYDQEIERLNEITLIARRKTQAEKRREEMNSLTDYGEPMSSADRLDVLTDVIEPGTYTALDLLRQMNGVTVFSDTVYLKRNNGPAKVMLDGLEVDGSFLSAINGDEISFIDLLEGADAATFMNAGNGVIALYSNTGNVGNRSVKRKPGIIDFYAKGFYRAKEFYKPNHINGFEEMNKPDLRTTLHWEPIVRTDGTGKAQISFFTSDIKSDYLIEIQGISDTGTPLHATETFVVE
ncbi:TonB-dependent receptor [Ochrovirga pacifica]|uniref:TonB-dependent receptor n=1 Tax=Ochrovirga pacifica TaxID=1042376 RepID=UPI0002559D70|nr:TonB-dependent receptor [Ochrovirga pacifica]